MVSLEGFDASKVEPNAPMTPVPKGDYTVIIESDEVKVTKKGDGKYLKLTMQIIDGEYKGRKLWDQLNLWNPSKQASVIAQQTLSAICHAVGILVPVESSRLHNKPMRVSVICKEFEGKLQNEVKGYSKVGEAPPPKLDAKEGTGTSAFSEPIGEAPSKEQTINDLNAQAPWST